MTSHWSLWSLVTGVLVTMSSMPTVAVYVSAEDARALEKEGKDPAEWVRGLVKRALEKRKEERDA